MADGVGPGEFLNLVKNASMICTDSFHGTTFTCCGCGACSIMCPTNAIEIKRDEKGFLKSFIDQDKCIRCKKCKTVCPFSANTAVDIHKDNHNLYMLKSLDKKILNTTASGGAGYEISKALSIAGYDVVGCIYDKEKREAIHRIAKTGDLSSLNAFRGSKYLQSSTEEAFNDVINDTNEAVVFGTSCQIAGIDLLLRSKK